MVVVVVQVIVPNAGFLVQRVVVCACASVANEMRAMTMIVFMMTLKDCKN